MKSEYRDHESWARERIHWLHTKQGRNGWCWIAQIHADGLTFEGRAIGASSPGSDHTAMKRRAADAAVRDYMNFVRRS